MAVDGATDARDEEQPLLPKEETKKKKGWVKWVVMTTIALTWFGTGIWVGCKMEGWRFITSAYVMVQIITTIGYGDILIQHDSMKMWIALYVLFGVLILAGMVSNMTSDVLARQESMLKRQFKSIHSRISGGDVPQTETSKALIKLCVTFTLFLFFLGAGTVFYATYEACTCSYGITQIEGCVEGEKCPATGGAVKSWIDSFYMAVVTLTTVGFGDHSPKSYYGRWFGVFWMLFGVVATGNFIGAASDFLLAKEKEQRHLERISDDLFQTIDIDKDGSISRSEFRAFAFLKFEMVSEDDMSRIDSIFEGMDTDKNGFLTYEECQHYFHDLQVKK